MEPEDIMDVLDEAVKNIALMLSTIVLFVTYPIWRPIVLVIQLIKEARP